MKEKDFYLWYRFLERFFREIYHLKFRKIISILREIKREGGEENNGRNVLSNGRSLVDT